MCQMTEDSKYLFFNDGAIIVKSGDGRRSKSPLYSIDS